MSNNASIDEVLSRHPRPQVVHLPLPTIAHETGDLGSKPKVKPSKEPERGKSSQEPWAGFVCWGVLTQEKTRWMFCSRKEVAAGDLIMVKVVEKAQGSKEISALQRLQHRNIVKVKHFFCQQREIAHRL
jgi:flagellar basal body L-ring protein FlgH